MKCMSNSMGCFHYRLCNYLLYRCFVISSPFRLWHISCKLAVIAEDEQRGYFQANLLCVQIEEHDNIRPFEVCPDIELCFNQLSHFPVYFALYWFAILYSCSLP